MKNNADGDMEKVQRYNDTFKAKQKLYELIKKIVLVTDRGYEEDDYTKAVHLDVGDGTLSYDPYYQRLIYYEDDCEYEISEDDLGTVLKLIEELRKRFKVVKQQIKKDIVEEIFSKPINILKWRYPKNEIRRRL